MSVSTIQPITQFPRSGQRSLSASSAIIRSPIPTVVESGSVVIVTPGPEQSLQSFPALTVAEISPAVAMSDDELACFYAVKFVLRSHKQLNDGDIQYAANYISSFYAYSQTQRNLSEFDYGDSTVGTLLTDEQLTQFLVYANKRGIGKFALLFNEKLDYVIKTRDSMSLGQLLLGPKELFVELYDNPYLSNEDRDFTIRLISREIYSIILLLGQLRKKVLNYEAIDDQCNTETLSVHQDQGTVNMTVLSTKCYNEVCIQDARILADDTARAVMSKYEKPVETVYTVDKPRTSGSPHVYCFDTLELIAIMTDNVPINPKSGEPFSEFALKIIRQRFHKEIALYRRYKELHSIIR